jgi:hypothetical protein
LASKGQSQFTNYKTNLNYAQEMDGIDEIQAQPVNRFYILTVGIGRNRNQLLLTT